MELEWAVALYDFTAETEEDLPFQQGDRILVTAHIDDEWWSGRINDREGFFPKAFVEIASSGQKQPQKQCFSSSSPSSSFLYF
uniref:SH3 domain-containing protein n=1 Tax=Sinocyclocheilus grahami TaxID=75366 RepID=A0A672PPE2_SINGR